MSLLYVKQPYVTIFTQPDESSSAETECLFGQKFEPLDIVSGLVYGECHPLIGQDDLPKSLGYINASALSDDLMAERRYKVRALQAPVFSKADIKSAITTRLSFGSRLCVKDEEGDFAKLEGEGGYVHKAHICPISDYETDYVARAASFVGLPYIWGGNSADGMDCSGLVMLALNACGIACPRNSGEQEAYLGHALDGDETLARGDLIFWKGHVGIMMSEDELLHANAHHMCVAVEPLEQAIKRIGPIAGPVTSIKRL